MKKFFAICSLLLLCSACSDKNDAASGTMLKLSSDHPAVRIILDGSTAIVNLQDDIASSRATLYHDSNTEITAKSDAEWCEVTISGNEITVVGNLYTDKELRAEVLLIGNGTVVGKLIVKLSPEPTIEVETSELEIERAGETRILSVSTNQPTWGATSNASWITATASAGKLTLIIAANAEGKRTGTVTLSTGMDENLATATVTIKQASNGMVLEYTLEAPGMTILLHATGNVDCLVDWGDGTTESYKEAINGLSKRIQHTYEREGVYRVSILGTVQMFGAGPGVTTQSLEALTAVIQWGYLGITSMENAFLSCKNLTSIPENTQNAFREVTTFKYAFWHTGLRSIPASLLKGCSKATLFTFCFSDTQITEIPEGLFDEIPNATDFNTCFSSNTKLTKIPAKLFANLPKASNMASCFQICPALTEIPAGLFKNCVAPKMNDMFYGCKALTKVPDELFAGCSASTTFAGCFQNCTALTSVGNDVFKGCTNVTTYSGTFFGCTELLSVPVNIFDDSKKVTIFGGTFRNNSKLASESPYTLVDGKKVHLYERSLNTAIFTKPTSFSGCFNNCTSLTDWTTINTSYTTWR